jgi:hypothetical protein
MSHKIQPGESYLLDGKKVVKVLKPINRSLTIFNIEANQCIESVEASRLSPLVEDSAPAAEGRRLEAIGI